MSSVLMMLYTQKTQSMTVYPLNAIQQKDAKENNPHSQIEISQSFATHIVGRSGLKGTCCMFVHPYIPNMV